MYCQTCGENQPAKCKHPDGATSHQNPGLCLVAFVFSVPGAKEDRRPIAGATGLNLDHALKVLHSAKPSLFVHRYRYGYRIANAWRDQMARSLGNKTSEASNGQILKPDNVARLVSELQGVELVVLCGKRPGYLKNELEKKFNVVSWWHTSAQALSSKFNTEVQQPTASERNVERAEAWALGLLQEIEACREDAEMVQPH